jgi:hypothetical protein
VDNGVGTTLKEARERLGIDLAEVEASTKIRARYLRAIEGEDWGRLPGDTYARSFIRTYAGYLGLDAALLAEQHRRAAMAAPAQERLPRVEPAPVHDGELRRHGRRIPPRALVAAISLALLAIALVAVLSSGGGGPSTASPARGLGGRGADRTRPGPASPARPSGVTVRLTATAPIWVCLLGDGGERLVDGRILGSGAIEGPFRSGSFTVSFGNGEVSMTVNGQRASIPATSSPVGYSIDRRGALRELPAGERPTCT